MYRFEPYDHGLNFLCAQPWSSLDKGESQACQITSPFNKKIGCFCKAKQPSLLLNGEVIWHAGGSLITKEVHALAYENDAKELFFFSSGNKNAAKH